MRWPRNWLPRWIYVHIPPTKGDPKALLTLPKAQLDDLCAAMLTPFNTGFHAPSQTALYLFADGSFVIENFGDAPVHAELNGQRQDLPACGWACRWK